MISILPAYKGPTASGAAYAIMPVQGYDKMLSDANASPAERIAGFISLATSRRVK